MPAPAPSFAPDEAAKAPRLILLLPPGPLLLDLWIWIEGEPYRTVGQRGVRELAQEFRQRSAPLSWEEVLADPRVVSALRRQDALGAGDRAVLVRTLDLNDNGLADEHEWATASRWLESLAATLDFTAQNVDAPSSSAWSQHLDVDGDGRLSPEEMARSADVLRRLDVDADETLSRQEANGVATQGELADSALPEAARVVLLGPRVSWDRLFYDLQEMYLSADGWLDAASFPLDPGLVATLDNNGNRRIDRPELPRLAQCAGHLAVAVCLGEGGPYGSGISLREISAAMHQAQIRATADGPLQIEVAGARVAIAYDDVPTAEAIAALAGRLLAVADRDRNGYLGPDEIAALGPAAEWLAGGPAALEEADANGDGALDAEELAAALRRREAADPWQIQLSATAGGPTVFDWLDANGDGRISTREMAHAERRLQQADTNGDGYVAAGELPVSIVLRVRRTGGAESLRGLLRESASGPLRMSQPAPRWFVGMDANGDGDISRSEFLGTDKQFRRLDANGDGFIDQQEAEAAEAAGGSRPAPLR